MNLAGKLLCSIYPAEEISMLSFLSSRKFLILKILHKFKEYFLIENFKEFS